MPMHEQQNPRDPHASQDANASAPRDDDAPAQGEPSIDLEKDILLPAKANAAREKSHPARSAPPVILDARPFVSSTPRLYGFVAASIAAGMVVGFLFGSHTGVKDALDAAANIDGPALSKAVSWKPEIASGAGDRHEIARLLDEVRSVRAQVESMRHADESLRAAERLRALEGGRDANHEASRANEKAAAAASARIDKVEARLDLLERTKIDRTPTGAVPKADRDGAARQADAKRDRASAAPEPKAPGGYVLRDVAGGVALVESRDGLLEEVARGDDLPGAGRVMAIEKRPRGWVVVTSRGVIDQRAY